MQKEINIDRIIEKEQEQLFRYACYKTGNSNDAADILQDVFVRIYSRPLLLLSVRDIRAYLYRSVSNACNSYHRQYAKNVFISIDETRDIEDQHEEDFTLEYTRIENMLSEITEEQTDVIRWRIICGKSFVEIAEILSLPVTTVKSRFKYGIDKIREHYFAQNKKSKQ